MVVETPGWIARRTSGQPKISRHDFFETYRAYRDGLSAGYPPANSGSGVKTAISYAATKLGLNPQTVRQRLAWAEFFDVKVEGLDTYGSPERPKPIDDYLGVQRGRGYTPPDLPPMEMDVEEEMDRAIAEFERRRAADAARRWMRFEVDGRDPFALVYVGDPHLDDPHTDLGMLRRHVRIMEETERMWAVGLGDYVNGWVGRLTRKYADQPATERGAYARAKWLFSRPIWWMLIKGNHCAWQGGGNPLDWMLDDAAVPLVEWEARFTVGSPSHDWKTWAAHDFPGSSQWNILHGPQKRAMMTGAVADLFVCGDKHCYGVLHTQHEHTGNPYWLARARGYKMQDDYARQLGFGEMTMGHSIVAVHDPRDGSIQCFDDVQRGADYLEFLRGMRK